jgi:hypothetical protein
VEQTLDERESSPFVTLLQPEFGRAEQAIGALQSFASTLVARLLDAGVIDDDGARKLALDAQQVSDAQRRQFDQAEDLSDFWLPL